MLDFTVLEAFAFAGTDLPDLGGGVAGPNAKESSVTKIKRALKRAIHADLGSRLLPLASKLPYFITVVSMCEVFMYCFAGKHARDALIYDPSKRCQVWRFATYMLLHNDLIHLGLNVIIQVLLAAPLELEQGHARTAAVYVGGGLAGALGASVFDGESMLVGASGGIYALLISHISHVVLNYETLNHVLYRSLAVGVLTSADAAYICYHVYVFNNESPKIGLAAHFSGAVAGLLLGASIYNGSLKWKNHVRIISGTILVVFHGLAIASNLTESGSW